MAPHLTSSRESPRHRMLWCRKLAIVLSLCAAGVGHPGALGERAYLASEQEEEETKGKEVGKIHTAEAFKLWQNQEAQTGLATPRYDLATKNHAQWSMEVWLRRYQRRTFRLVPVLQIPLYPNRLSDGGQVEITVTEKEEEDSRSYAVTRQQSPARPANAIQCGRRSEGRRANNTMDSKLPTGEIAIAPSGKREGVRNGRKGRHDKGGYQEADRSFQGLPWRQFAREPEIGFGQGSPESCDSAFETLSCDKGRQDKKGLYPSKTVGSKDGPGLAELPRPAEEKVCLANASLQEAESGSNAGLGGKENSVDRGKEGNPTGDHGGRRRGGRRVDDHRGNGEVLGRGQTELRQPASTTGANPYHGRRRGGATQTASQKDLRVTVEGKESGKNTTKEGRRDERQLGRKNLEHAGMTSYLPPQKHNDEEGWYGPTQPNGSFYCAPWAIFKAAYEAVWVIIHFLKVTTTRTI